MSGVPRLDAKGRLLRLATGVVSLVAAVLILPFLDGGSRAVLFVPFLFGFLGLLQAATAL